ncbi:MAG: helix-turn-helix domain-containing protein [Desulfobacteraceae bacterium]|nr:helix-turn-helix domain-containing protein [Desulfobacteraceae bacterium]
MAKEVSDKLTYCQGKSYHRANFFKLLDSPRQFKEQDMQKNQDEYLCFLEALKYKIKKEGRGGQQRVAIDAGISKAYLSQLLAEVRRAGFKTQVSIARAFGFDYYKFLEFGEKLLSNSKIDVAESQGGPTGLYAIQHEHKDLIDKFINKETAYEINKKLLEIERNDPDKFREIQDYIDFIHERIKAKKIVNGNSE